MPTYEAQILKQYSDPNAATLNGWPLLRTRHSKQRPSCWTVAEKNEMIDTVLRKWICPPIYIIVRNDLTNAVPDGEWHVFDGAHKLEAVIEFMDDKFALKATASSCAEIIANSGKKFSELPIDLRHRIRQYNFVINIIDAETATDEDKLATLWERLNRAGKKVNNFELAIPKIGDLLENIIRPSMKLFIGTVLFPASESKRGSLEQLMMLILAIYDRINPKVYSTNSFVNTWAENVRGKPNHTQYLEVLINVRKILDELCELNTFHTIDGALLIHDAHSTIELPYVLGILARQMPLFRHKKRDIAADLKKAIFEKSPAALLAQEKLTGRNATYQKRIYKHICALLEGVIVEEPRLFTKQEKNKKLIEQNGCCAICAQ